MKRGHIFGFGIALLASTSPAWPCGNDSECKGDRVCEGGKCVPPTGSAKPKTAPSVKPASEKPKPSEPKPSEEEQPTAPTPPKPKARPKAKSVEEEKRSTFVVTSLQIGYTASHNSVWLKNPWGWGATLRAGIVSGESSALFYVGIAADFQNGWSDHVALVAAQPDGSIATLKGDGNGRMHGGSLEFGLETRTDREQRLFFRVTGSFGLGFYSSDWTNTCDPPGWAKSFFDDPCANEHVSETELHMGLGVGLYYRVEDWFFGPDFRAKLYFGSGGAGTYLSGVYQMAVGHYF